ncbi:aminotransferase class I/II-fold pyridoxal phosphate-dependent enzyme [Desulfobacula sp.]|uniref:pyridoxal phosphate-dependent aminotransferase n=1 Tax=Desulfobacula sp. TaxID=2593537 RepID=UPI00260809C0|nr:aminotransferase class I/II-fold pyridoxal phosphate-dependent enzyme [Desulfobacula sp.]
MILGHGGNIKELAKTMGCSDSDIIDMSSNLNPLGPPETIEKVICDNLMDIRSLPEPDAETMRKGFAGFHGIDHNTVAAGNGTTWFIYTIPKALGSKKVLIAGPTYSDYKDACLMHNITFTHCLAKASELFVPDMDDLSRMAQEADTVFICNPNNPTGSLLSREKLVYLIQKHKDTIFIIDESYLPFVDQAREISLVSYTGYENLIVLSSMSKIFRIPGLRTGFLSAARGLIEQIMVYYQPWSVNALAQAVINHIFDHPERIEPFYQRTRDFITLEKQVFLESLKDIKALQWVDSCTYFLLARLTGDITSTAFCRRIGQHKILIRDCANFIGLSDQYVRFSLKKRPINARLADLIKQVVNHD